MKRRIWARVQDGVLWPAGWSNTPASCSELVAMTLGVLAPGGLRESAPLEVLPPRPGPGPGRPFEEKPLPERGAVFVDGTADADRSTAVTASWASVPISASLAPGAAATSAPAAVPLPLLPVAAAPAAPPLPPALPRPRPRRLGLMLPSVQRRGKLDGLDRGYARQHLRGVALGKVAGGLRRNDGLDGIPVQAVAVLDRGDVLVDVLLRKGLAQMLVGEVDVADAQQPAQGDHIAEEIASELVHAELQERDLLARFAGLGQADVGDHVVRAQVNRATVGQAQDDVGAFDHEVGDRLSVVLEEGLAHAAPDRRVVVEEQRHLIAHHGEQAGHGATDDTYALAPDAIDNNRLSRHSHVSLMGLSW